MQHFHAFNSISPHSGQQNGIPIEGQWAITLLKNTSTQRRSTGPDKHFGYSGDKNQWNPPELFDPLSVLHTPHIHPFPAS